jgi:hypothetical protein
MDGFVALLAGLIGFLLLDLVAVGWGVDSRELDPGSEAREGIL